MLVLTLLLLLLLVVIVGQLSYTASIDRILAANQSGDLIVDTAISSGVQYAIGVLLDDMESAQGESGRKYDAPNEPWAAAWQQDVGEAKITGQLFDEQSKYNLLWIYFWASSESPQPDKLEEAQQALIQLLSHLRPNASPDGKTLAERITIWIQGQQKQSVVDSKVIQELKGATLGGGQLSVYALSELLLINGIDEEVLYGEVDSTKQVAAEEEKKIGRDALVKHLTLWGNGKLNVNTASKSVLMSIHPTMDEEKAQAIIDKRQGEGLEGQVTIPYAKKEVALPEFGAVESELYKAAKNKIDVASNVFLLDITATWRSYTKRAWIILRRDTDRKTVTVMQYLPR